MKKIEQNLRASRVRLLLYTHGLGRLLIRKQLIRALWVSRRWNSMCKGPEAEVCLVGLKKSKQAVWPLESLQIVFYMVAEYSSFYLKCHPILS